MMPPVCQYDGTEQDRDVWQWQHLSSMVIEEYNSKENTDTAKNVLLRFEFLWENKLSREWNLFLNHAQVEKIMLWVSIWDIKTIKCSLGVFVKTKWKHPLSQLNLKWDMNGEWGRAVEWLWSVDNIFCTETCEVGPVSSPTIWMRLVDRVNISGDITDLTGVHLTQCGDRLASAAARWAGQAGRQLVSTGHVPVIARVVVSWPHQRTHHCLRLSTAGGHSDKEAVGGGDHGAELHQEEVSAASGDVVIGDSDHGQHLTCHWQHGAEKVTK